MHTECSNTLLSLSDCARARIARGDYDSALRVIHDFVERIITEPLCTSMIYGAKTLDYLCQEVGGLTFKDIAGEITSPRMNRSESVYVYIVTKLQESGGHTRVIGDFIKARPSDTHVVLSTELAGRSNTYRLAQELTKGINIDFEMAPRVSFLGRLEWLQTRLMELRPDRTYLFNHHQDSVAVAAIRPEMELNASFYHHGDHHLCLGVFLSHLEHIDPHPMGYYHCRGNLGINNSYIPLTIDDGGRRPAAMRFMSDGALTTCTAARSNKIEIPYTVSYLEVIPKLLNKTGGRHVHIGRLSPWAIRKIKRGMKQYGIGGDKFVYIPWVTSVWSALHDHRVDLYIASFPYGGGLTLIEAMGAGVPVALHRHMYSRVLSGVDLAYPEAFSWRYPDELLEYTARLTSVELDKGSCSARLQYEMFHRREILVELLNDRIDRNFLPLALKDDFTPEMEEWAAWTESQLSCKRVIQRGAYRLARAIRRRFF